MFNLQETGIAELIVGNKKLIERLKKNKDYEEMLDKIVEKAKNNCPVKSRDMEKAIRWDKQGSNKYKITVEIPYAKYIEYGTRYFPVGKVESPRGYKSTSGKMASVPFLRSAVWDVKRNFPGKIRKVIDVVYN